MNKKFSTLLTMGLLMAGSLFSMANAQTPVTVNLPIGDQVTEFKSGAKYFVVQSADATLDAGDFLLGFAKDASVATTVVDASTALAGTSGSWKTTATTSISKLEANSYIWKVTESKEGTGASAKYFYTFTNASTRKNAPNFPK